MVEIVQNTGNWRYVAESGDRSKAYPEVWLGRRSVAQRVAVLALLAALYFLTGKGGLMLANQNGSVSLVWPATGLAIAAMLLLGRRVWPAIALGAFLVNLMTTGVISSSLGIAAGNTLEALAAAWVTQRCAHGWRAFDRAQDVLRFAFFAVFPATSISATMGVTSLCLAGLAPWNAYVPLLSNWWLGDAVGAMVITPLLVLLATQPKPRWTLNQWIEAGALFGGIIAVCAMLFGGLIFQVSINYPLTFVCIPFLFWTAFRFGPREASLTTFIIAAMAITGTIHDRGRFAVLPEGESLVLTQAFLGVVALTTLGVAASVSDSKRLETLASQLAAIVESSYDAIVGKTINGTIISWNHGAEHLYGYSAAEAIGQSIEILSPAKSADEIQEVLRRSGKGKPSSPSLK